MRWVVEYDWLRAARFVRLVGHPEPAAIKVLQDAAILRVERDGADIGYFWFVWTGPDEMALYACVAPDARGRWSRQDLGDLHKFPELLGARRLMARPPDARVGAVLGAAGWHAGIDGVYSIDLPSKWSARYGRSVSYRLPAAEN